VPNWPRLRRLSSGQFFGLPLRHFGGHTKGLTTSQSRRRTFPWPAGRGGRFSPWSRPIGWSGGVELGVRRMPRNRVRAIAGACLVRAVGMWRPTHSAATDDSRNGWRPHSALVPPRCNRARWLCAQHCAIAAFHRRRATVCQAVVGAYSSSTCKASARGPPMKTGSRDGGTIGARCCGNAGRGVMSIVGDAATWLIILMTTPGVGAFAGRALASSANPSNVLTA
jgi:hypothetical protein